VTVLNKFSRLAANLQSTAGRLEKERFLRECETDAEIREILHFLFNPFIVSGISDKKINKFRGTLFACLIPPETDFLRVIKYFTQHNTGRDTDIQYLVSTAENSGSAELAELVYSVIKKDLKLGIQAITLNKVFGAGFIPAFDVMLAENFSENIQHVEGRDFIITEKLDGVRCVLLFQNDEPKFFSRQGKAIDDLVEISAQAAASLDPNYAYDGELLLDAADLPSKDLYRATVKIVNSDAQKRGVVFWVFDKVLRTDFVAGYSGQPCAERKAALRNLDLANIREVKPLYTGGDIGQIEIFLEKVRTQDREGLMINIADAPYEGKRTKNLLKAKVFNTADVLVESIEEGSGQNKGKLGAVIVKFTGPDGRQYNCRVGSGFKQDEREHFFKNPDEIVGRIIEIGYFEASRNQDNDAYSLRFPTFKHVRTDKTEISMY